MATTEDEVNDAFLAKPRVTEHLVCCATTKAPLPVLVPVVDFFQDVVKFACKDIVALLNCGAGHVVFPQLLQAGMIVGWILSGEVASSNIGTDANQLCKQLRHVLT